MKKVRPKTQSPESADRVATGPVRTCAGCRKSLDQDLLVRYVLSPQGDIVVDYRRKLPGRGVYTCIDRGCLETAVKRGQLSRSLRHNASPSAGKLWQDLHEQVRCKVLNLLGMARKSGQAVSGTRQVLLGLQAGCDYGLLVRAVDLSAASAERLDKAAGRCGVAYSALFSKDQLGQLLGKSERGVVALKNGPLAEAVREELERLKIFAGEFNG